MNFDLHQATIKVLREKPLGLRDAKGISVAVDWGDVWITQEGDREDYVLGAGQTLQLHSNGLTLIYAIDEAAISLLEPCDTTETVNHIREQQHPSIVAPRQQNASGYLEDAIVQYHTRRARELRNDHIRTVFAQLYRALSRPLVWAGHHVWALILASRRHFRYDGRDRLFLP